MQELQKYRTSDNFSVEEYCFREQIDFIRDPARFKTAVCSRRAGKTIADAAYLIDEASSHDSGICLYVTLTRSNAKKLIWPELLKINHEKKLGGEPNETELSLKMPRGSYIYCSGAKDKAEIEKFRGLAIRLCIIDEAQLFRSYIESLIDDVIGPTLIDYGGTLALTGTPGPVKAGYYYQCAGSNHWSHHAWTLFQNPHIEKKSGIPAGQLLDAELKRKGVGRDNPTIKREWFGEWANDVDSLVFKYRAETNHFDNLPLTSKPWDFIIGVDLGFEDADAIGVIGWNQHLKAAYLVEEIVKRKQGITELATELDRLYKKYNPMKIVVDAGGLGKKIAEEIRKRYSIPITAAEKTRKNEYIELLNDAMRSGRFFAKKDSLFAQDCQIIEWDDDKSTPEKLKISDSYHSDIVDAVLYAFRESLHWLYEPEIVKPKAGTPEWFQEQEALMEQKVFESLKAKDEDIWGDVRTEWDDLKN